MRDMDSTVRVVGDRVIVDDPETVEPFSLRLADAHNLGRALCARAEAAVEPEASTASIFG